MSATDFWQENQVGGPYETHEESKGALHKRQMLFPRLSTLMPTDGFENRVILDFGCGPGHDTILFLEHGVKHVYFADVSWRALKTTNDRLKMHGYSRADTTPLFADDPLPRVDHIHCAGVLHHMAHPLMALERLRAAAPSAQVMVYDGEKSEPTQSLVPITEWWTPREFIQMCDEVGWEAVYRGSYECSSQWRPNCWAACFSLT